jgi:hypothetical protein
VLMIVFFEFVSFCLGTVSSNRGDIDKSGPILDKGPPLDGNI